MFDSHRSFAARLQVTLLLAFLVLGFKTQFVQAQQKPKHEPMPGLVDVPRDERIPSPVDFFGFSIGSRHLRHDQVVAYFKELANHSDRVKWFEYGQSHGGRPLFTLAISSPSNIVNLDIIRKSRARIASGRAKDTDRDSPLVMFMGYCVHGDEASAVNAAPIVAYHLVSGTSTDLMSALEQAVFFVDPSLNPDGVDRFANWVNENRGRFASDRPEDREHQQPWPGGRTNYYWFDLNRDWLPLAHPESQGRIKLFHQWLPNVVLDYHEMGGNSTYFFQPGVPTRINPLTPPENLRLTRQFAARYAESMDQAGELYFTEEVFDDFYVGKGSTYPDLNGSVGILFEQGSTRGLKMNSDGINRHFADTIANQVRTSLASVDQLIELKQPLVEFQTKFFQEARKSGSSSSTTAYLLTGSPSRIRAAQRLLIQHRIQGDVNVSPVRISGTAHQAGNVLIIPTAQPQFVLLESLMQTEQNFQENIFYDVSAWHLPSAFDLDMHRWEYEIPQNWKTGKSDAAKLERTKSIDWDALDTDQVLAFAFSPTELDAPKWVSTLMQMDVEVRVSMVPFDRGSDAVRKGRRIETKPQDRLASKRRQLPEGTYLVLKSGNQSRWNAVVRKLRQLSSDSFVELRPISEGRNPQGPDLGSSRIANLPKCNPALVVGAGTSANNAGAIWNFLDHHMQQPATLIDADRIARVDLNAFTCVILPAGNYAGWTKREATVLENYAQQGGTIIACESAIGWLNRNAVVKVRGGSAEADSEPETYDGSQPLSESSTGQTRSQTGRDNNSTIRGPSTTLRFGDAREAAALQSIAGALFMTKVDTTHPLAYGFHDQYVPVFRDSTSAYASPNNPLLVAAKYDRVIAGYVSQRNRDRIQETPAVWFQPLGRGRVIMIADNPVFRGYVRSSERFLTNAMLLGPILRVPSPPREE
jgi:hypothetical protein